MDDHANAHNTPNKPPPIHGLETGPAIRFAPLDLTDSSTRKPGPWWDPPVVDSLAVVGCWSEASFVAVDPRVV